MFWRRPVLIRLKNCEGMKTLKFNGSSNTSKAAVFAQTLDKVSVQSRRILMEKVLSFISFCT